MDFKITGKLCNQNGWARFEIQFIHSIILNNKSILHRIYEITRTIADWSSAELKID